MIKLIISESDLKNIAKAFQVVLKPSDIILCYGEMGTGKTTFTRELCSCYGIKNVSSPTFSLVQQYESNTMPFFHIDLYRLIDSNDFTSIDLDKYLPNPAGVTIIEWSEKLAEYIPDSYWKFEFSYLEDMSVRQLCISAVGKPTDCLASELLQFNIGA